MVTGRFPSMDSLIKIMNVSSQCITFFFWIEDFIEINKRQQTHHTHTKYTIYIE